MKLKTLIKNIQLKSMFISRYLYVLFTNFMLLLNNDKKDSLLFSVFKFFLSKKMYYFF